MGTSLGMGFGGAGLGDGQGGLGGIPGSMRGRCTLQERLKRLREGGGTEECENAVQKSLRWLKAKQNSDGSWGRSYRVSMTGLAILAYLGHCETPRSTEYGETVTKGITFLVNENAQRGGKFNAIGGHHWVYEHGIATYALCEALTFVKELKMEFPGLEDASRKAVNTILEGQHPSGSWDYGYDKGQRPGDSSILGWHVQALKAAHHAGFPSKELEECVKKALKRLDEVQAEDGTIGYTDKGSTGQRLAAVGALCYQMWGRENDRVPRNALRWINKNMEPVYASPDVNLYAWYYTTLALFQRGSTYWDKWNKKWRDEILRNQNDDGSWKDEGGGQARSYTSAHAAGGDADIYRVCLNTLSLEVYYRFLPGTGMGK
jgi:squalene cyclase